jgi:outer membrane protein insertion porin family
LAGYAQETVSQIKIEGNNLISDAKIVSEIKTKAGQAFNKNTINQDVKNLYQTGFFQEVSTESKESPEGVVIVFKVEEKPVIEELSVEGQRYIRKKQILDQIELKEGSFVDEYRIKQAIKKIEDLYSQKGFTQAEINYQLIPTEAKKANLKITIAEKGIIKVRVVEIKGNKNFSDNQIKKLMKTRKAWLFNKGVFKKEEFEDDLKRILRSVQR